MKIMKVKIFAILSVMIISVFSVHCVTENSNAIRSSSFQSANKNHGATISGTCYTPPIRSDGEIITTIYKYEVRRSNIKGYVVKGYRFIEENYQLHQNNILCVVLPYENSVMEAFFAPYKSYKDYQAGRLSESQFKIRRSVFNINDFK